MNQCPVFRHHNWYEESKTGLSLTFYKQPMHVIIFWTSMKGKTAESEPNWTPNGHIFSSSDISFLLLFFLSN